MSMVYKRKSIENIYKGDTLLIHCEKVGLVEYLNCTTKKSMIQLSEAVAVMSNFYFGGYYHLLVKRESNIHGPLTPISVERTTDYVYCIVIH